ncbi:hypothetical protein [Salidesulfovibrio onnuriiensis]|uniref:hypothetical protein n=1 Tax=Salidesulfovibrio onnuriiensis TaxID=2583823 RepID=UPI0011C71118|nr:hypothetical protein [Salidesulfovibrio onnuriiensis]
MSLQGEGGEFRCAENIRQAVECALLDVGITAETVAGEISRLVGERVSPEQVMEWCRAGTARGSIPLGYVAALMRVLGDDDSIVRAAGITGGGKLPLRIGRQHRGQPEAYGSATVSTRPEPHLVRAWMSANRITVNDIAAELEVTPVAVRRWVLGSMTSAKVRKWFLDRGCPACFVGKRSAGAGEM